MNSVAVIEDDDNIRNLILLHVAREGLAPKGFASAEEALNYFEDPSIEQPSLLILDWMLPGLSGVDLLKRLRSIKKFSAVPVLMVTARAEPQDIIEGLNAGADDYITKPFEPSVLVARIRAIRRRAQIPTSTDDAILRSGDLVVDRNGFDCRCCGQPIELTPSEFKLLVALMEANGRVLTRESLIEKIQGDRIAVTDRTVDTHVFTLRKKLGTCADLIDTARGIGYRIRRN